jgi:putative Mg2+ transporter-C (MgtC) family protein
LSVFDPIGELSCWFPTSEHLLIMKVPARNSAVPSQVQFRGGMERPMDFISGTEADAALRLLAACVCGMLIGADRGLRGKPTGMRTLGLVALGAALVTIVAVSVPGMAENADALSRAVQGAIQGVLTGVGFIGAGVVLRDRRAMEVHGLTTAASVWITAVLGIACALAPWLMVGIAIAVSLVLLVLVRPIDHWLEQRSDNSHSASGSGQGDDEDDDDLRP